MPVGHRVRVLLWCAVATFLLAWNGVLAMYTNPFLLLQQHDGTQYHLLVRNRLMGHYEVDDTAHTVRAEGQNPMWRPALVWIEESLARVLGSVQASASVASALGATLLELGLLWLASVCFGPKALALVGVSLFLPLQGTSYFMRMAVGQGPETWAAAALVAGLAGLAWALRRQSWGWAAVAGIVSGLAEWFRAGSYLIFLVPAFLYLLRALWQRDRKQAAIPSFALATFLATVFISGMLVSSRVNKTVVALTHRLQEQVGAQCIVPLGPDAGARIYLSGLQLCPNLLETNCDYAVNQARDVSTLAFLRDHGQKLADVYFDGVKEVLLTECGNLRDMAGNVAFFLFAAGILLSLPCRKEGDFHALAISAGALAHYLGPIALLRGADATHYLLVILPFVYVVAAYGAKQLIGVVSAVLKRLCPRQVDDTKPVPWPMVAMGFAPVACLSVIFFHGAFVCVTQSYDEAEEDRAAVAALGLEGRSVAVRSMGWFQDTDVQTVLLPYATVPELVKYAQAHRLDGLLLWEKTDMRYLYFSVTPYPTLDEFHQALEQSQAFGTPRVSGAWRWYPLRPFSREPLASAARARQRLAAKPKE